MKQAHKIAGCIIFCSILSAGAATELVLETSKDTFGRSNSRTRNSGASKELLVASSPGVRSLIAFDLSSVTNEITAAVFKFRINDTMPAKIDLLIAPMVQTEANTAWGEGQGNLGVKGQNSRLGEASFAWSAFRDVPWEAADGSPVVNLMDSKLWKTPLKQLNDIPWVEGQWLDVAVDDVSSLETIRNSEHQTITFGLWGKSGNGLYQISSKESGHPAKLMLTLKEKESK
jgi:hypothetical protein